MKRFPLTMLTAALALAPLLGHAQAFPEKSITFVVPFAAGTATDQIARAIGNQIAAETKQAVIIDNKAGASGFIASQAVAKAPADGYTVLITTNTTHAANEHLFKKLPYDPVKDFAPITALGKGGQIMVVNPHSPPRPWASSLRWPRRTRASTALAAAVRPAAWRASCCNRWPTSSCCTCPTRATRWP